MSIPAPGCGGMRRRDFSLGSRRSQTSKCFGNLLQGTRARSFPGEEFRPRVPPRQSGPFVNVTLVRLAADWSFMMSVPTIAECLVFPPGAPVSSTRKLISSSSFHRLDMTLAVAEALNPNKPNVNHRLLRIINHRFLLNDM